MWPCPLAARQQRVVCELRPTMPLQSAASTLSTLVMLDKVISRPNNLAGMLYACSAWEQVLTRADPGVLFESRQQLTPCTLGQCRSRRPSTNERLLPACHCGHLMGPARVDRVLG
jgi:hypothetical protein